MKVLQVITSLYTGGAEKILIDSIPLYIAKGVEMELLLLNGAKTPFFYELEKKRVTVYSLSKGEIKTVYNSLNIFRIIPYLRKYDIIHVHLFPTLYWVALAKKFSFNKTKLIFTEHCTYNTRIKKGGIWRILDKFIYRQYSAIVSVTSDVDEIIRNHLSEKSNKFRMISNGINISQYVDLSSPSIDEIACKSKIIIIQIAGFRKQKDQPTLIRALQYLPDNVFLLLVGDGETRSQCEQLVKDLNLSQRVSFSGIRTDVPELLKSSDIAVLSSLYEGLSLSCIEAMALGKPLIASDVPGLREIVNGAGLLFPVGDEMILAEKINALITNPELYKQVSQACSERSKQYDINVMVDKYIELYQELRIMNYEL